MLHSFLLTPFADPVRQAQYAAVAAALGTATGPDPVILLGNFAVGQQTLDAAVVRADGVTVLLFVPDGGHLTVPAPGGGAWYLNGHPLPSAAAQPFAQLQLQRQALEAWLAARPGLGPVASDFISGIALFARPVTFGPEVEDYLLAQPDAEGFQLLGNPRQLPRRLQQLAHPTTELSPAALEHWLEEFTTERTFAEAELPDEPAPTAEGGFWTQKARQLWRWLGAEDIPSDPPYSGAPDEPETARREEQRRFELLRQQVRAELSQHNQAAAAREAEREQAMAQLQAQLQQAITASSQTTALQAQLAAETRDKAAMAETLRVSRDELAARNDELNARIQQLGLLIQQLQQAQPALPASATTLAPRAPSSAAPALPQRPPRAAWRPQPLRIAALAAGLGLSAWGLTRLPWPKSPTPTAAVVPAASATSEPTAADSAATAASDPTAAGNDTLGTHGSYEEGSEAEVPEQQSQAQEGTEGETATESTEPATEPTESTDQTVPAGEIYTEPVGPENEG